MTSEKRLADLEQEAKRRSVSKAERAAYRARAAEAWGEFQRLVKEDPDVAHLLEGTAFDPSAPPPESWVKEVTEISAFFGSFVASDAVRLWHEHWARTRKS